MQEIGYFLPQESEGCDATNISTTPVPPYLPNSANPLCYPSLKFTENGVEVSEQTCLNSASVFVNGGSGRKP